MKAAYKEHHQIYSAEDVEAARRFQLAASDLTGDLQRVGMAIGKAVLPLLEQFVTWLVPIVDQIVQWVNNNTDLIQTVFEVAAGVAAAGAGAVRAGDGLLRRRRRRRARRYARGRGDDPVDRHPGIVVGSVAYLAYLGGAFDDLSETATDAWGGIMDAIKAGDLGLAGKIAMQGLYIVWLDFRNWALMQWDNLGIAWKVIMNGFLWAWDWLITQLRIGWVRFEEFLHIMNKESADAAVKSLQDEEKKRGDVRDQDTAAALDAANAVEADRQKEVDDAKASLKDMAQTASAEAKKAHEPKALPPAAGADDGRLAGSHEQGRVDRHVQRGGGRRAGIWGEQRGDDPKGDGADGTEHGDHRRRHSGDRRRGMRDEDWEQGGGANGGYCCCTDGRLGRVRASLRRAARRDRGGRVLGRATSRWRRGGPDR